MWPLISKFLAAITALGYVVAAAIGGGPLAVVSVMTYLLLPLACIFFSEEMGAVANIHSLSMEETPGCFVAAGGWLLLLLPIVVAIIWSFGGNQ